MMTLMNTGPPLGGIEKFVSECIFLSTNLEVCPGIVSYQETLDIAQFPFVDWAGLFGARHFDE